MVWAERPGVPSVAEQVEAPQAAREQRARPRQLLSWRLSRRRPRPPRGCPSSSPFRRGGGLRRGLRRLARRSRRARPGGTRAALAADPGEERTDLDRLAFGDEDLAHGPVRG